MGQKASSLQTDTVELKKILDEQMEDEIALQESNILWKQAYEVRLNHLLSFIREKVDIHAAIRNRIWSEIMSRVEDKRDEVIFEYRHVLPINTTGYFRLFQRYEKRERFGWLILGGATTLTTMMMCAIHYKRKVGQQILSSHKSTNTGVHYSDYTNCDGHWLRIRWTLWRKIRQNSRFHISILR